MKLHQINMNRQDLYLCCKNLRKWSYIFIITSNVGTFMTKKVLLKLIFWNQVGWIFIIATIWKWHQINVNRQDLYLCWQEFKKMVLYFHYHLKCRHTHDKKGAIEVDLLKSSRMNFCHCYYLKLHQINMNRQDLYLCCMNLRKWSYIFIITSNVGIFMTKKVLLKLIFWNQVGWIFDHCYYLKLHQINMNRQIFVSLLQEFKNNGHIFSLSPQMSAYSWQKRCYWSWSFEIKSDEFLSLLLFEMASN